MEPPCRLSLLPWVSSALGAWHRCSCTLRSRLSPSTMRVLGTGTPTVRRPYPLSNPILPAHYLPISRKPPQLLLKACPQLLSVNSCPLPRCFLLRTLHSSLSCLRDTSPKPSWGAETPRRDRGEHTGELSKAQCGQS